MSDHTEPAITERLCRGCGKPKIRDGYQFCGPCADERAERLAAENGSPAAPGEQQ